MRVGIQQLIKDVHEKWRGDHIPQLAAAQAYYTIFSLPPLAVLLTTTAGLALGQRAVEGQLASQLEGPIGQEMAQSIQSLLADTSQSSTELTASIISLIALTIIGTTAMRNLQVALNIIWEVPPQPTRDLKTSLFYTIRKRLTALVVMSLVGLLLAGTLALSIYFSSQDHLVDAPRQHWLGQIINFLLFTAISTLLFAIIYRFLPRRQITWADVMRGATFTALLFAVGNYVIGLYLLQSDFTSTYGAAGSFFALLFWIYYSAYIFFIGAAMTQVYARETEAGFEQKRPVKA